MSNERPYRLAVDFSTLNRRSGLSRFRGMCTLTQIQVSHIFLEVNVGHVTDKTPASNSGGGERTGMGGRGSNFSSERKSILALYAGYRGNYSSKE